MLCSVNCLSDSCVQSMLRLCVIDFPKREQLERYLSTHVLSRGVHALIMFGVWRMCYDYT